MRTNTRLAVLLVPFLAACGGDAGEEPAAGIDTTAAAVTDTAAPAAATPAPAAEGAFLDPNAASREELLGVPGMTPEAADALVGGRPYQDMRGVDAALAAHMDTTARERVYERVWKPLDLNTATAEEIELIPRVGPRMRHEFEEYRPYRDIARFRREMGKYVDDAEVERLARYVTINS